MKKWIAIGLLLMGFNMWAQDDYKRYGMENGDLPKGLSIGDMHQK